MTRQIQQKIEHKEKEVKLIQFVLKKVRQIKERKTVKKEEQALANLDEQLKNL